MMKLIYGTKNTAKIDHMKDITKELELEVVGIDSNIIDVKEKGTSIRENARIKALHFYNQVKEPVFSCDSGLYFDHLDDDSQTGIFIRRINGKRLSDEEMIDHYSKMAKDNGGEAICRYRNAICLVISEDEIYEYSGMDISSEPFKIVEKAHKRRTEGFPLDSISVEIRSNRYYFDMTDFVASNTGMNEGFVEFFKGVLNEKSNSKY